MIKKKMGNFPQARRSKQRWGIFHKRDDQNKNGELSTSKTIQIKMESFPQAR
jgi:hypothetical protein